MRKLFVATFAALLVGCAYTPEQIAGCRATYMNFKDIEACEQRVVRREDIRFKRAQEAAIQQLKQERCWIEQRGIWDSRVEMCRNPFEMGMC